MKKDINSLQMQLKELDKKISAVEKQLCEKWNECPSHISSRAILRLPRKRNVQSRPYSIWSPRSLESLKLHVGDTAEP